MRQSRLVYSNANSHRARDGYFFQINPFRCGRLRFIKRIYQCQHILFQGIRAKRCSADSTLDYASFVGTVLGGIWADQSWGRFWGWDPKENGALLIVLWNALILHARWGGMVRDRGVAILAILGNMITAWSWFGTNQLSVGLHAYGFDQTLARSLVITWIAHLGLAGVGMLPTSCWWSLRPKTNTIGTVANANLKAATGRKR